MNEPDDLFEILADLVRVAGVSGNEEPAKSMVEKWLAVDSGVPELAGDELGNCWIELGPEGVPQRMLIAHLDEIGLRVTAIREDGLCRVQNIGGIDPQLWEGSPVRVHTDNGAVPGCIAPISHHVTFRSNLASGARLRIEDLYLDVGATSPGEIAALGIKLLDPVTWPKTLTRLGDSLVQGRSLDDRFGCCALVVTANALAKSRLQVPTIIAWSVQEEVGLRGARALARRFPNCTEVIAVDSFTVGTGPRDNKQYDMVKLGGGPVLRSWDSTTLVPRSIRQAILHKAASLGIDLQYGFMPGGNDASMFEDGGSRVMGMSVPVQYSHSQVERIHLDDLRRLTQLLVAWCKSDLEVGPAGE